MTKLNKTLILLTVIGLSSCSKTTISTTTSTGGGFSSDTDSSDTGSTEPKDYGTSYDEFYNMPGEFAKVPVSRTDTLDNQAIYDGYYASLSSWDNGRDLKQKLYNIIYNPDVYVANTYEGNWDTNRNADESLTFLDEVDVIYNVNSQGKNDTYSSSNTTGWSREHAFCASLLTGSITATAVKTKGIATDFHNLFAANSGGNSSRSDKNLGLVSESEDISTNANIKTRPGYDYRFTEALFEPNDTDKGMLSRAILYMSVMYGKDSWNNNPYKVGEGVFLREDTCSIGQSCIGNSSTLVDWSNTYLVSRGEYRHNVYVQSEQHNRNPFVDFVNLADYVYGNKRNSKGTINDLISSYAYLGLGDSGVSNLAVEGVQREFQVGESLSSDDLTVYEVNKDYSKNVTTNYAVQIGNFDNVYLPYKFEDEGEFNVKIHNENGEISYPVSVSAAGMKSCNNVHMFDSYITSNKTDSSSKDEIKAKKFKTGDINWGITFNDCSPSETDLLGAIGNDYTYGVKIGSTSKYCGSMVFLSEEVENIDRIYFKGATAASTNESLIISVVDDSGNILSTTTQTINRNNMELGVSLDSPMTGHIKIQFTNANHKAIYVTGLAFNTTSV